jgi:exopolysaccharide production protein ExoQ
MNTRFSSVATQSKRSPAMSHTILACTFIIAFFIADHDLLYSLHPFEGVAPEAFAVGMKSGTLEREVSFVLMGAVSAILLFLGRGQRRSLRAATLSKLLVVFAAWAGLSILWAEAPWLVFRRFTALLLFGLAATAAAKYLSKKQVTWFVAIASATYLVVGVAAEVALETFHPFNAGYRFAGTVHPNVQGTNCALLLLSSLALLRDGERSKLALALLSAIGLLFLVLTGSRTALASALAVVILFAATALYRRGMMLAAVPSILAGIILVLVAAPATSVSSDIFLLGRQEGASTLTARVDLWRGLSEYVRAEPLLGYGYGGFWTPAHIFDLSDRNGWSISSSHSEYLELILDLGFVGLAIYIAIFIGALCLAARATARTDGNHGWFYFGLLLFYMFDSFLESHLFSLGMLTFVTLVAVMQLDSKRLVVLQSSTPS